MASKARLTPNDLWRMGACDARRELVDGRVIEMGPASVLHGKIMARLSRSLVEHVERHGLGEVLAGDVGFALALAADPDRVRAPDVAYIARDRLSGSGREFFRGAPDLAAEILSPSETPTLIRQKVSDYLEAGARLVWVISTEARTATVYRADGSVRLIGETELLEGEDVLPGYAVRLSVILG